MGCCGPAGAGSSGMQNVNTLGLKNKGIQPQGVQTGGTNQTVPPELAKFIADLGVTGQQSNPRF